MHRNKELMERSKMSNTSRFLEKELWRLKVHVRRCILCTARMRNEIFSIFDRLYLATDVSYGDEKGVTFLNFASSFMWCEQFCLGRTFYFDDFAFIGKHLVKI